MADKKINIGIGYTLTDKSGLEEMQSYFQRIVNAAAEPGKKMDEGLQQAGKTAQTLDKILEKTFNTNLGTLNVTKFNQELQKAGLTVKQVKADLAGAGNQGTIAFNKMIQAIASTNIQLKESNKVLKQMYETFQNTIRFGISSSIFNGFTNSISKAYEYTKKLDTSLNNIRIVTGKSTDEMDRFADKANKAAQALGASTLDMTQASLIYYQQGLSDAEAQARAETTVKVANVTGQKADEVSEQLTAVWNGYKVSAVETEVYIDKLAAVAASTASDLEELSTGMSKVASAAASMGVDFDDLTAQISTIVSVTRQVPESVGTALKTIYARIGDLKVDGVDEFGVKLGEVSSQLEVMGINILDQEGNMRDMSSIMAEVAEKWQYWTEAQKQAAAVAIAGKRQYNNLIALFENWDMYSDALDTAKNSLGTLQKQQDIYMESTQAKLDVLKATWEGLYKSIGKTSTIQGFIGIMTDLVKVMNQFVDSFGGGIKSIIAFGTVIANIFNKQIANSITTATQRSLAMKQNLELAKSLMASAEAGVAEARQGGNDSEVAHAQAVAEATRERYEYVLKIHALRGVLTEEQQNDLLNKTKLIAEETEEIELLEIQAQKIAEQYQLQEQYVQAQEKGTADLRERDLLQEAINEREEAENQYLKEQILNKREFKALVEQITSESEKLEGWQKKLNADIKALILKRGEELISLKTEEERIKKVNEIIEEAIKKKQISLGLTEKETKEIQKQQKGLNGLVNTLDKKRTLEEAKNSYKQETEGILEIGEQALKTTSKVTVLISTLSSLTMAWSSITSMISTWNDENASFEQKITQSIMTLGMTIPILVNSWTKLNEIFKVTSGIFPTLNALFNSGTAAINKQITATAAKAAVDKAAKLETEAEIEGLASKIFLKNKEALVTGQLAVEELNLSSVRVKEESMILPSEKKALIALIKAKIAETKATEAATIANEKFAGSLLANPVMLAIVAVTALVAGIAAYVSIQKKNLEQEIKLNEAEIDRVNAIRDEVNANKELYDSYENLYGQYKNHLIEKDQLAEAAQKAADKYRIELTALEKLTGQYDEFTEKIKKARGEELDNLIDETEKKKKAAEQNIVVKMREKEGRKDGDKYILAFSSGISQWDESEMWSLMDKNGLISEKGQPGIYNLGALRGEHISADINNIDDMISVYEKVKKTKEEAEATLTNAQLADSEYYQEIKDWVERVGPTIEAYRDSLSEIEQANVNKIFEAIDIEQVNNIDEYNEKIKEVKKNLSGLLNIEEDSVEMEKVINGYLAASSNDVIKKGLAIQQLQKKLVLSAEDWDKVKDKDYLLGGNVNLTGLQNATVDQINKLIDIEKKKGSNQDFDTVSSLREKVASSGKLTNSDLKEKISEESQLAKEFFVELSDFENQSALSQLDTLNEIVAKKIEAQQYYLENAKELAEKEYEIKKEQLDKLNQLEDRDAYAHYDSKFAKLKENLTEAGKNYSDEYKQNHSVSEETEQAFQEAKAAYFDYINELETKRELLTKEVNSLKDIIDNGLDPDLINDSIYTMMIDGIDGVISESKMLLNLTNDIGEGWTIAADKIENFAKNFPELLDNQENYNILADGSVEITEEGKKAFEEQLALRKETLAEEAKAYVLEIQKQIDMKEASARYYRSQAEAIRSLIGNKQKSTQIQAQMEQNLANYIGTLSDITGQKDTDITQQILENSQLVKEAKKEDAEAEYDYYYDVGKMIEAAFATEETKEFKVPETVALKKRNNQSQADRNARQYDKSKYQDLLPNLKETSDEELAKIAEEYETAAKKLEDEIAIETSKKIATEAYYQSAINGLENLGKAKDKQNKKDEKTFDDEFDRYYDIKKAIDLVGNALDKLSKIQSKLHGKELIQSLKNENRLIKQQAQNYETLYEQQKVELSEIQSSLKGFGANFDENGFLTNYATLTASALKQYEEAIAKKNAGAIDDATLQTFEKSYEKLKKQLDRYDALFYDEMKDTQDKLNDYQRQILENNLKIWETEIQIKLDTKQAERDWADFLKEINNDFRKVYKDLNIEMDHFMTKLETYSGLGTIETDLQAVYDVITEIDKLNSGQASSMFESISDAQEKLKELDSQLEEDAKNMKSLWEEAWNTYLEGIDQANDKLEFLNERFDKINEELEFQGRLIELLYGEKAYSLMNKLYRGQEEVMQNNISNIKTQADMWHQLWEESGATLDNQAEWTSDQQKYYENWQEQQSKLNDLVTSYIELLQKDYLNTINDVLAQLEKSLTGGNTLEDIKEQWERITDYTDKYYDDIKHAYEVQKFANKIDQDIAKATSIKNQQKLQTLREREITYLREKDTLTKYDLDAAEARYQIALKEIALEEAQQNKTAMKLVRNEQGNWAYQYIADADEVSQKQDDLLTSYGDLYKLASDAYKDNLSSLQSLQETYLQSSKDINSDLTLSEEEKNRKLLELDTWYQEQYRLLAEENELYRQDLITSGSGLLLQVYQQDQAAYEYMTSVEREMLDSLVNATITSYQDLQDRVNENYGNIQDKATDAMAYIRRDWTSSAQQIAETWNADDGESVKSMVLAAHDSMKNAADEYQYRVDELAIAVKRDFGENGITGSINEATSATVTLNTTIKNLCDDSKIVLGNLKLTVQGIGKEFETVNSVVTGTIKLIRTALALVGITPEVDAESYDPTGGGAKLPDGGGDGEGNGGGEPPKVKSASGNKKYYIIYPSSGGSIYANGEAEANKIIASVWEKDGGRDPSFTDPLTQDELHKYAEGSRTGAYNYSGSGSGSNTNVVSSNPSIDFMNIVESLAAIFIKNFPEGELNSEYKKHTLTPYQPVGRNGNSIKIYDTGGYTGEWGEDGKLAVLHQKELVLNANDTANFLNGVSLLRDMVSLNGSIERSIAAAIGGMAMQLSGANLSGLNNIQTGGTLAGGDTYYVNAEFPNANDTEEIKQAILSLPNVVSQYIHQNV